MATQVTTPGDAVIAAQQHYKYQTSIPPGIATPDKLETSIGTLTLKDGYPDTGTVRKIYDNLDASRALQAFLLALPIVNQAAMREAIRKYGPDNITDILWEELCDSKTVQLTANSNVVYNFVWLDTHKGPVVVEVPPGFMAQLNDFWYKWAGDIGIAGEDKGKGGKYLVLPPGYKGEIPKGYFILRSSTYGNWFPIR